jgi:hypothetical protein
MGEAVKSNDAARFGAIFVRRVLREGVAQTLAAVGRWQFISPLEDQVYIQHSHRDVALQFDEATCMGLMKGCNHVELIVRMRDGSYASDREMKRARFIGAVLTGLVQMPVGLRKTVVDLFIEAQRDFTSKHVAWNVFKSALAVVRTQRGRA